MQNNELNSVFESEDTHTKPEKLSLVVGGKEIHCESDSTVDVASLTYVVGTNGFHGGDAGHGAKAVLTLVGTQGFCLGAKFSHDKYVHTSHDAKLRDSECLDLDKEDFVDSTVSIVVEGDAEIQALADVLIRAGETLNRQIQKLSTAKRRD